MAIKTLEYTVSALGIEPNTKQFCGVQGDHNIYQLKFNIDSILWNALTKKETNTAKLYYRFDLYNGEGAKTSTEPQVLENLLINFDVEEWLTRYGGIGKVVLVITLSEDGQTHLELYSFPALLQFKNRPTGSEPSGDGYKSMTTIAEMVRAASERAVEAAETAEKYGTLAEETKTSLTSGFRLVLDGNRADADMKINDVLDSEMSSESENAVMNKAIKSYIDNKYLEAVNNLLDDEIKKTLFEMAHPVGSLYWSSEENLPSNFFGTWERIKDTFIYAANDGDDIGSPKGNENGGKVTLTDKNIAPHKHIGIYYNPSSLTPTPVNIYRSHEKADIGISLHRDTSAGIYPASQIFTGANIESEDVESFSIMPPYKAYYCWIRVE